MLNIDKNHVDFKGLQFCIKALDQKSWRMYERELLYTGTEFVATDTSRLHIYTPEHPADYTIGFYAIVKSTKPLIQITYDVESDPEVYPNWQHLIAPFETGTHSKYSTQTDTADDMMLSRVYSQVNVLREAMRGAEGLPHYLSVSKVKDAIVQDTYLVVITLEHDGPTYFTADSGKYRVLLMPIKDPNY